MLQVHCVRFLEKDLLGGSGEGLHSGDVEAERRSGVVFLSCPPVLEYLSKPQGCRKHVAGPRQLEVRKGSSVLLRSPQIKMHHR